MSQEDLAKATGVSIASIQGYESGEPCPLLQAAAMAEALGVTVNDLCGIPKSAA